MFLDHSWYAIPTMVQTGRADEAGLPVYYQDGYRWCCKQCKFETVILTGSVDTQTLPPVGLCPNANLWKKQ